MISEIKDAIEKGITVIGKDRTLKLLKAGQLQKVYYTRNCTQMFIEELSMFDKDVELHQLDIDNDQLGTQCKKQFGISVIGILKK